MTGSENASNLLEQAAGLIETTKALLVTASEISDECPIGSDDETKLHRVLGMAHELTLRIKSTIDAGKPGGFINFRGTMQHFEAEGFAMKESVTCAMVENLGTNDLTGWYVYDVVIDGDKIRVRLNHPNLDTRTVIYNNSDGFNEPVVQWNLD